MQNRLEGCLLQYSTSKKLPELMKILIEVLPRQKIQVIVYLGNMFLMSQTVAKTLMARDTLVFLLQGLGFVINIKQSVLQREDKIHVATGKSSGFHKMC